MNERSMTSEQQKAAHRASLARSENKIFFKRKVLPFAVIVSALCTLLFWWRSLPDRTVHPIFEEKSRVVEEQRGLSSAQQMPIVKEAEWESGRPVVGQWSRTFKIPVGCRTKFNDGNGTSYKVRLRNPSVNDTWVEHVPGKSMNGSEIQFMILQEGAGIPFTLKCS